MNARVKDGVNSAPLSGMINFGVGMALMSVFFFLQREPFPSRQNFTSIPWFYYLAGLIGGSYAMASPYLIKELGALQLAAITVSAQVVLSLLLDHFGWLGIEKTPATVWRIAGAALVVAGMLITTKK